MELRKVIRDLEDRIAEAERAAASIPALRRQLTAAKELDAFYNQTEWALSDPPSSNGLTSLPRTEAVLHVLRESAQPLSAVEISRRLGEAGRHRDQPKYVSAALSTMKQQGKVMKRGHGKWSLRPMRVVPENESQAAEPAGR